MSTVEQTYLHVLELMLDPVLLPAVDELIAGLDLPAAAWSNPETGATWVRVYCGTAGEASVTARQLAGGVQSISRIFGLPCPEIKRQRIRKQDWAENWKQYFHPFRASRRLVIKPSWESYRARSGDIVLEIDPGMSFGTGYHGTTRACLEFMDELSTELGPVSFLDAGCGSGILSLAAAKLGYEPVVGFDHDPGAVMVARENLERAGAKAKIDVCDLAQVVPAERFRLICANILAVVLLEHAENLISFLADDGSPAYLILSGILESQYAEVKTKFEALGLAETRTQKIDEWQTGCFCRKMSRSRGGVIT
jgi:ribosomal protein L11 methyltransferase